MSRAEVKVSYTYPEKELVTATVASLVDAPG